VTAHGQVSIRRLEPGDLEAAARLCSEAIARGESTLGPDPLGPEALAETLKGDARYEAWAVDDREGRVAGWAALAPHTKRDIYDTVAELLVFVSGERRRHGFGRALVHHAITRATELRFRALVALLQPAPSFAVAWAVRLGFRSAGALTGVLPVGPEWRDILIFQKWLQPAERGPG